MILSSISQILKDFFFCHYIDSKLQVKMGKFLINNLYIIIAISTMLDFVIERLNNLVIPCKIVAILMYFSLLSQILWMMAITIHIYFQLIRLYTRFESLTAIKLRIISASIGYGWFYWLIYSVYLGRDLLSCAQIDA